MSKNSDSTHDLEWTGDRAFATENSDGFKVYQCKHCEDLFFATAMLLPCPQRPTRKSVRRKAMSNYNWPKIREYLATKVLGWQFYDDSVYGPDKKQPPGGDVGPTGDYKMEVGDWRPDEDLNQAYVCADKFQNWKLARHKHPEKDEKVKPFCLIHDRGKAMHQGPAKAICLAVLKASGADLSDFEEKNDE